MGFRFRRSIKILPGVRLNVSKSGLSTSIGPRGATISLGKRGARANVGLPGTGLSYSTALRGSAGGAPKQPFTGQSTTGTGGGCAALAVIVLLLFIIGKCSTSTTSQPAAESAAKALYVTADALNCRAVPAAGATVLTKLARATQVQVTEQQSEWSKVAEGQKTCWVSSRFLAETPPIAASTQSLVGSPVALPNKAPVSRPRASTASSRKLKRRSDSYDSEGCPCSGSRVCIGPRGGRYCITSGGNKRYGV